MNIHAFEAGAAAVARQGVILKKLKERYRVWCEKRGVLPDAHSAREFGWEIAFGERNYDLTADEICELVQT